MFSQCGGDEFSTSYEGSGPVDLGRFLTSTIVVTGFALPIVLTHSEIIRPGACIMSIIGGSYVHLLYIIMIQTDLYREGWCMVLYWHIPQRSSRILVITIDVLLYS